MSSHAPIPELVTAPAASPLRERSMLAGLAFACVAGVAFGAALRPEMSEAVEPPPANPRRAELPKEPEPASLRIIVVGAQPAKVVRLDGRPAPPLFAAPEPTDELKPIPVKKVQSKPVEKTVEKAQKVKAAKRAKTKAAPKEKAKAALTSARTQAKEKAKVVAKAKPAAKKALTALKDKPRAAVKKVAAVAPAVQKKAAPAVKRAVAAVKSKPAPKPVKVASAPKPKPAAKPKVGPVRVAERPGPAPLRVVAPCEGARSRSDYLLCSNARIAAADRRLARAYRQAQAAGVPPQVLHRQQGVWLRAREEAAHADPRAVEEVYEARIAELEGMARY